MGEQDWRCIVLVLLMHLMGIAACFLIPPGLDKITRRSKFKVAQGRFGIGMLPKCPECNTYSIVRCTVSDESNLDHKFRPHSFYAFECGSCAGLFVRRYQEIHGPNL